MKYVIDKVATVSTLKAILRSIYSVQILHEAENELECKVFEIYKIIPFKIHPFSDATVKIEINKTRSEMVFSFTLMCPYFFEIVMFSTLFTMLALNSIQPSNLIEILLYGLFFFIVFSSPGFFIMFWAHARFVNKVRGILNNKYAIS